MRIHLPNSAFLGNIDPFFSNFDPTNPERLDITFNKKWVSVHPVVLCMVAALGMQIKNKECITIEQPEAKSKHYLERMRLFRMLEKEMGLSITEHEAAGRFIPLTQIKDSDSLNRFITDMVPMLHLEPSQTDPIKYVISELVRNVIEHSESPNGAVVCAQYYPRSNAIKIGVVDTGIGIKETISRYHHTTTDLDAIRLALTPGITGTTGREVGGTGFNAGVGLFFIKTIAKINHDFFVVYSGKGMFKLLKRSKGKTKLHLNPFDDACSKRDDLPTWPGTVVGIDITLERNQPFDNFLETIKRFYQTYKKKKKKEYYKRARFE